MSEKEIFLSIITPAYNRAHLLGVCFDSLQKQTASDFEWIIVDDGSIDQTESVVETFLNANPVFPIKYIKKENGGKHTALNTSHPYIQGHYVLLLDSDDSLTPDAVETVRGGVDQYMGLPGVGMVTFLKGRAADDPNCYSREEGVPVDILRHKRALVHSSDCCEIISAELFKKYPFPVFEGERFVGEGALWNRIDLTHKCVYVNRVIYICEYLEGGLTKQGRAMRIRNPKGGMYSAKLNMAKKNYFVRRVINGLLYTSYGFFAKMKLKQMVQESEHKKMVWACLPFGWMIYTYWKWKYLK